MDMEKERSDNKNRRSKTALFLPSPRHGNHLFACGSSVSLFPFISYLSLALYAPYTYIDIYDLPPQFNSDIIIRVSKFHVWY